MDIQYNKKTIDLLEENKKYILNKETPVEVELTPMIKEEVELTDLTENINQRIRIDAINKTDVTQNIKSIDPYKEDAELNLKYVTFEKEEVELTGQTVPTLDGVKIISQNIDDIKNPINTGIAIVDSIGDSLASGVQSVLNYGESISRGFSGIQTPQSLIDNYALYEKKSDIKKTVDFSAISAIPYNIDKTIKQFQSGSALNSIISGVIGSVNQVAELVGSFYDASEVLELITVNYNQVTNGGKLFAGEGPFGFNMDIGGGRPGIKIKKKTADGKGYETQDFSVPDVAIDSRENIGFLYVRPFQNKIPVNPFNIPFQTNPKISEDTIQANYASEQFLNRVGELKSFINTSGQNLSIETSYIVLHDGSDDNSSKRNNYKYSSWMNVWTPTYIQAIENAYRSLVYSTYYQGINDSPNGVIGLLKPPSVRIIMSSDGSVSFTNELYAYPKTRWVLDSETKTYIPHQGNSFINDANKNSLSRLKVDSSIQYEYKWHKTFVVTGVQISREDDSHINKNSDGNYYYNGFKVNLTLSEVTENYLDCIPDFASYYNSFAGDLTPEKPSEIGFSNVTQNDGGDFINNLADFDTASSSAFNTINTTNLNGVDFGLTDTTNSVFSSNITTEIS